MTNEHDIDGAHEASPQDASEEESFWMYAGDENFGGVLFDSVDRLARTSQADKALRERLILAARRKNPMDRFTSRIALILDISKKAATRLIDRLANDDSWQSTPLSGVDVMDVDGGPSVEDCMTAFVRIEPGGGFPVHEHLGDELIFLVQGKCVDTEHNQLLTAGSLHLSEPGTSHGSVVSSDEDVPLIYLAVVRGGLKIGDTVLEM